MPTPTNFSSLPDITAEKRIWQAVILQALMDASANGKRAETQKAKREARSWLEDNSADFQLVCENAGLQPHYVKRIADHVRKNDYQWRTPPGMAEDYEKRGGKERYAKERQWEEQRLERIRNTHNFLHLLDENMRNTHSEQNHV